MNNHLLLPSFSLDENIYKDIPQICKKFGKKIALIGGKIALSKASPLIQKTLAKEDFILTEPIWYGGVASLKAAENLAALPAIKEADMLFAIGGGRAIDTVKVIGDLLNKPVFSFPTLASNCAPITQLSILYHHDTKDFHLLYPLKACPIHCFIELNIIIDSPYEYLWAGIGDALSKQYETCFSVRGFQLDYADRLGVQIAKDCSGQLYEYGLQALKDHQQGKLSTALANTVAVIIINTGLVSLAVNLDYSSSLAHALYYGITVLPQGEEHLHGAIVNYGTLVLLTLDKDWDNLQTLLKFSQACKLPKSLADLQITKPQEIELAVDAALQADDLKITPYPITKAKIMDAIKLLEDKVRFIN